MGQEKAAREMVMSMSESTLKSMSDSMLISMCAGLKVDYRDARKADDAERMQFCEKLLKAVDDELVSRAKKQP